jgi:site-specific recombinase XerD
MLTSEDGAMHNPDVRDVPIGIEVTLAQATEVWLSRYSSANTRAAYSADLRKFLAWYDDAPAAMHLTAGELTRYRAQRVSEGASAATIDRQFAALRAFYEAACELGLCHDSPFGIRPQSAAGASETATLTPTAGAWLRVGSASDSRTDVLVQLLLGEGLRLAEVLALDHADVSGPRHAKRLRLVRHGNARSITLDEPASQSMGELERCSSKPGPLFTGPSRGSAGPMRLTRFGADHLLKQAAAAAGIRRPVSANVLRRTHVTSAQHAGVPIDEIRRKMGHRDVRTTRRYLAPTNPNNPQSERS